MKTQVKPSVIHGMGLFAAKTIRKGAVIGEIKGQVVTEDGPHVLWLSEQHGVHVENDMRYINHDDEPNAAYFDDLKVRALRAIKPGEEITHDYTGETSDD